MAETSFDFHASPRKEQGKRAARRYRRQAKIPAILYGGKEPPEMLVLNQGEVDRNFQNEAIFSHILNLHIEGRGQPVPVVIKDVQYHPFKNMVLHIDFQRVVAGTRITMTVPLHFVGEETCVGVKKGGRLLHLLTDVEVSCLPKDLPEFIEVDVSHLDIGDTIMLSDLKLPEEVELVELAAGHNLAVVTVEAPTAGEEEEGGEVSGEESA